MVKQRAIIIGAGLGGITTSIYLAKLGMDVDVYEKTILPGGRCGQIIRDGYRFDIGATMMLMPGIYRQVFESLGLDLEKTINLKKLDNLYTIYFDNGEKLAFSPDESKMREQLEGIEKGSSVRERDYVRKGYELYKVSYDKLIGRNFFSFFEFFNIRNALLLVKLKTYIGHMRYASRYFRNKHLQMAYTFQNIYVGQNPFKSPALFSMIPAAELTEGSLFPVGGMYSIADRLMTIAGEHGVRFHFAKPVSSVMTDDRRATGVTFSDGTTEMADIIVANADLPYVYRELLPESRKSKRIDRMKYSCSAIVLHWGVDKRYPQLDQHNVFLAEDFREGLDRIFNDKTIGEDPCFYIHAPAITDPTAAPEGCDAYSIEIGVGHIDRKNPQDWDSIRDAARNAVLKKLKRLGMTDIEEHIRFEICTTPETWEEALNVTRGSIFGSLGHNVFQMGYFRPHNRDHKYRNLYFTGGSTHPGNGIPFVLLSAKLVSERIARDLHKENA